MSGSRAGNGSGSWPSDSTSQPGPQDSISASTRSAQMHDRLAAIVASSNDPIIWKDLDGIRRKLEPRSGASLRLFSSRGDRPAHFLSSAAGSPGRNADDS